MSYIEIGFIVQFTLCLAFFAYLLLRNSARVSRADDAVYQACLETLQAKQMSRDLDDCVQRLRATNRRLRDDVALALQAIKGQNTLRAMDADDRERIAYDRDELRDLVVYLLEQRDFYQSTALVYQELFENPTKEAPDADDAQLSPGV